MVPGIRQIEVGHVDAEDAVRNRPEIVDLAHVDLAQLASGRDDQILEEDLGILGRGVGKDRADQARGGRDRPRHGDRLDRFLESAGSPREHVAVDTDHVERAGSVKAQRPLGAVRVHPSHDGRGRLSGRTFGNWLAPGGIEKFT